MADVSIVIPCYNEAGSLPDLHRQCRALVAAESALSIELIYVNNGSVDDSRAVFDRLLAQNPDSRFIVVDVPDNRGYGYGIKAGLQLATGTLLSWTHADLQTDPADIIRACGRFSEGLFADRCIVKGCRMGRNAFDVFFTAGMSFVASRLLGVRLSDINAQPKIFNRRMIDDWSEAPDDFSLDVWLLYKARVTRRSIDEFPVLFGKRRAGVAQGGGTIKGKVKLIKRTFRYLVGLRKELKAKRAMGWK